MAQLLKHIYVVVCNGISDIGKGWLTASITGLDPKNTLPIKIDPLLNRQFPQNLGIPIQEICNPEDVASFIAAGRANSGDFRISDDFETYYSVGAPIYPECNIVGGDLIKRFIESPDTAIRPGEIKKRTLTDLSRYLAEEISEITKSYNPTNLIIEVGGTIEDSESIYIPSAIRFLKESDFLGVQPEIILLSFFEYAESHDTTKYRIKTQHIRRGIIQTCRAYYHLQLKACFVRRRQVPETITDDVLLEDMRNAAYETQISPEKMVLLPNIHRQEPVDCLDEITRKIKETHLFQPENIETAKIS